MRQEVMCQELPFVYVTLGSRDVKWYKGSILIQVTSVSRSISCQTWRLCCVRYVLVNGVPSRGIAEAYGMAVAVKRRQRL